MYTKLKLWRSFERNTTTLFFSWE